MTSPRIFTISPGSGFLHGLGRAFLENRIPGLDIDPADPFARADVVFYLPNRRATRAFADILVELNGDRPMLLPDIRAIGDIDPLETEIEPDGDEPDLAVGDSDFPPAIHPLHRLLLLTRLVQTWCTTNAPSIMQLGDAETVALPGPQSLAVRLAAALASLLDQVETEGVDLAAMSKLVPEDHAAFWEISVDFLSIIGQAWPKILQELGRSSIAGHRNQMILDEAARLQSGAPVRPVIAAGSTGSIPATAELLHVISTLPAGAVVLPGLDHGPGEDEWQEISNTPSHPQFNLAGLIARFGISRDQIPELANGSVPALANARHRIAGWAMQPEQTTAQWGEAAFLEEIKNLRLAEDSLTWVEAATAQEEALVIALKIRSIVEDPERSVALVTPDRNLARRVIAELERWQIVVDDSAGLPLNATPPGIFASLVAEALAAHLAPVPLLAMLKHPLCTLGAKGAEIRRAARILERCLLRGPRPEPGLAGLRAALKIAEVGKKPDGEKILNAADHAAISDLLERIEMALAHWPNADGGQTDEVVISDQLVAHRDTCMAFAATGTDETSGLFKQEAGEALEGLFSQLILMTPESWRAGASEYAGLFKSLAGEIRVRRRIPAHPRIHIWGLLEARLMQVDAMILGGLNEGTWPGEVSSDPWLSRAMRGELGLSSPERRISLAGHDFVQAFAIPDLMLTRAIKSDGDTSVPSRWLLRLEAVLKAGQEDDVLVSQHRAKNWLEQARRMDHPDEWKPVCAPAPTPPLEARPRKLSVSRIEVLVRDPYSIYARHILKLNPVDPLDMNFDARGRGTWIHEIMHEISAKWAAGDNDENTRLMRQIARAQLKAIPGAPETKAVLLSRFDRLAPWFAVENEKLLDGVSKIFGEISGKISWDSPGGPFTLNARADRIDLYEDGRISIYDYKTGKAPTAKQAKTGLNPQLLLEAAMALEGGFDSESSLKAEISKLAYIEMSGRMPPGKITLIGGDDPNGEAVQALDRLKQLIAIFDDETRPYYSRPHPEFTLSFGDFDHLARVQEWINGEEGA